MSFDPFASELATALIVALVPVVIGGLGYLARAAVGYLRARVSAEHFTMVEQIASSVVAGVEMTLRGKAGEEKKAAALALVRSECAKRGIVLDEAQIVTAIEAAVYRERIAASK